ncbi:MAG: fibronectin type III domain-containing protein [Firmicutes bacterium]|nr:fibronectin type III domain-containing protein [Bacillota bacterium]
MKRNLWTLTLILITALAAGMIFAACGGCDGCDGCGCGSDPDTPAKGGPGAPQSFTADIIENNAVFTSWLAPEDEGKSAVVRYEVQKSGDAAWTDNGIELSKEFTGLSPASMHTFKVRAVNGSGAGHIAELWVKTAPTPFYDLSKLPKNVEIVYTNSASSPTVYTVITKLGLDIYTVACPGGNTNLGAEYFFKHTDGVWTEYERPAGKNAWALSGKTYDTKTFGERLADNACLGTLMMPSGFNPGAEKILAAPSSGSASVAAKLTTKHVLSLGETTATYYHQAETGLFFRTVFEGGAAAYTINVTAFDTTVVDYFTSVP